MKTEIVKNGKDYSQLSKEELVKIVEKLDSRKKYGLIWDEEKVKEQFEKDAENALPVLKEISSKEITDKDTSKPVNILIEGDNYHALSVLNFTHQGKVDVIYIDPPYNTGNKDFKYNDNYVDREDAYRHSKWLSFMAKRIQLARNLLKDSGVIFISIDDNEASHLKLLCDEIFGEKNFIAQLVVQLNPRGRTLDKHFAKTFEYILVFAKDFNIAQIIEPTKGEEMLAEYDKEDAKGKYRLLELRNRNPVFNRKNRPNLFYPLFVNPKDGLVSVINKKGYMEVYPRNSKDEDGCWTWGKEKAGKEIVDLVGKKVSTGAWRVYRKDRLIKENGETATTKEKALWLDKDINNENGKEVLKSMFHEHIFDFPKSVELIKKCINLSIKKDGVILDFFAGSGTTGHAVLELNQDGGKREFILCTNDEGNICTEVCYPRLKNVSGGYKNSENERVSGTGGSLKYFKTKFVKKNANGDDFKTRITNECTEMLCLREGVFNEIKTTSHYRIFQQGDKTLVVYYSLDRKSLPSLKKELEKIEGEKILYCFTLDATGLSKTEFANWHGVTLEPIPQRILDVYKQIYEY